MEASQGAELERVGVAVRGLIRLWKSVEESKAVHAEVGGERFEVRRKTWKSGVGKKRNTKNEIRN
jgi:hypothetical protein